MFLGSGFCVPVRVAISSPIMSTALRVCFPRQKCVLTVWPYHRHSPQKIRHHVDNVLLLLLRCSSEISPSHNIAKSQLRRLELGVGIKRLHWKPTNLTFRGKAQGRNYSLAIKNMGKKEFTKELMGTSNRLVDIFLKSMDSETMPNDAMWKNQLHLRSGSKYSGRRGLTNGHQ